MRKVIVLEFISFDGVFRSGKKLFNDGTMPSAFKVTESQIIVNSVIVINYERACDIKRENI